MDKEYISSQQYLLLLAGYGVGTSMLLVPTILVQYAKQGAFLSTAFAFIPSIAIAIFLSSLNKMYPGQSLVQYSAAILGVPGKILALLFIWFAFHLSALVLRNIGNFVNLTMLAETPTPIVYLIVVAITAFALLAGLETAGRAMSLLMFLAILISAILLIFTLPNADFSNMLPPLGNGWFSILKGSIYLSSFPVGEFLLFGMIIFKIKDSQHTTMSFIHGQLLAALIGTSIFLQVITILGPERASRSVMAIVSTLNSIQGSNLLLIPFALTWFIFAIIKFYICYYAFIVGFAHWAEMDDYRPLVLPGGALIICIAIILFKGIGEHQNFNMVYWPAYSLPFEYGIPLLLWLAAGLKILVQGRRP
ncbi:GerAB/ArcD/ProY family transporter [Desulfotomaculum defluvii]